MITSINSDTFSFTAVLGFWTQGLEFAKQVLCHLSHALNPFCFSYFSNMALHFFSWASLDCDPLVYTSHVAWMTGMHHHTQLTGSDDVFLTFGLGWPWSTIFPSFPCRVTEITGVSYCYQPQKNSPSIYIKSREETKNRREISPYNKTYQKIRFKSLLKV
jgi:hypothetical protein